MKLHLDKDAKTVAFEGKVNVNELFNCLMSWFPEEWESWSFVQFVPTIKYQEIIVERPIYRNPYWSPFNPIITYTNGTGGLPTTNLLSGTSTISVDLNNKNNVVGNPSYTTSNQVTLNLI